MNSIIYVDNVNDGEVIPYQILLLCGHIQATNNSTHEVEQQIIYISWNGNPEEQHSIKNGAFRAILHLATGDNSLTFRFNDCTKNMMVRFAPPIAQLPYQVQPVYIICAGHNGRFQAPRDMDNSVESAAARILIGAKLIQTVLGELFHVSSFGRKTFCLADSSLIFRSELTLTMALTMSETELWEYFGREIMSSNLGQETTKYLAFVSHTEYQPEKYQLNLNNYQDLIKITDGYVALGGGGLALFGSASLFNWPSKFHEIMEHFTDETPVDRKLFLAHTFQENTKSWCFSTTLGAVIHELLHAFELAHSKAGIMGREFFTIKNLFCCNKNIKLNSKSPLTSLGVVTKSYAHDVTQISMDKVSLTESSIVILAYNKWLNNNCRAINNRQFNLSYDASNRFVKSSLGIRVVEFRLVIDSLVIKSWIFPGRVLKFSHRINFDGLSLKENDTVILFVLDNNGNFVKESISVCYSTV